MRLATDAVRAGLLHPDGEVRALALEYFGGAFSPDPEVMAAVIRAAEQFGLDEIGNSRYLAGLKQSPESVRWLAAQIGRLSADEDARWKATPLRDAILAAELPVLAAVAGELDAIPRLDAETRAAVRARVALASLPPEELWARLEAAGRAMDALNEYPPDEQREAADGLVAALAQHPAFTAERALGALRDKAVEGTWLEIFAVQLVRHLRLAEALPELIQRSRRDDDAFDEIVPEALAAIGTDAVIDALLPTYDGAAWGHRFTVALTLAAVHTDGSTATALALAARETDAGLRCRLYEAAAGQFDTAAVEPVRRFLLTAGASAEERQTRDRLVAACELTGERFPEFERWKLEGARERERVARRIAEWECAEKQAPAPVARAPERDRVPHPDTVVRGAERVGRNDPCPCGSGKKFKKCCGANRPDA